MTLGNTNTTFQPWKFTVNISILKAFRKSCNGETTWLTQIPQTYLMMQLFFSFNDYAVLLIYYVLLHASQCQTLYMY